MTAPDIDTTWAEQAAGMDTVDELAGLWRAGAEVHRLGEDGERNVGRNRYVHVELVVHVDDERGQHSMRKHSTYLTVAASDDVLASAVQRTATALGEDVAARYRHEGLELSGQTGHDPVTGEGSPDGQHIEGRSYNPPD